MDGIMRGDNRDPATMKKEYVQWQRGPITEDIGRRDDRMGRQVTGHWNVARAGDPWRRGHWLSADTRRASASVFRLHEGERGPPVGGDVPGCRQVRARADGEQSDDEAVRRRASKSPSIIRSIRSCTVFRSPHGPLFPRSGRLRSFDKAVRQQQSRCQRDACKCIRACTELRPTAALRRLERVVLI